MWNSLKVINYMESYGYVETRGLVTAIEAADTALKTSNVKLTNCYYVKRGIVTIEVTGDVAAVNAAIDAAAESARKLGNYLSSNVIARIDTETKKILVDEKKSTKMKKEKEIEQSYDAEEIIQIEENTEELKEEKEQQHEEGVDDEKISGNSESDKIKKLKRKYQDMRVIELKTKVNNLSTDYTWNQIKGMTKKKLIEILLKND